MRGVFQCIEVGFFTGGHTHEDLDQVFSRKSIVLRTTTTMKLSEVQDVALKICGESTTVSRLMRLGNWSGLFD